MAKVHSIEECCRLRLYLHKRRPAAVKTEILHELHPPVNVHGGGRSWTEMPSDPTKVVVQKEAPYDLLWPTVTTKPCNRLGDPLLRETFHLVVTVGHNKSYGACFCTITLVGLEGISVQDLLPPRTLTGGCSSCSISVFAAAERRICRYSLKRQHSSML